MDINFDELPAAGGVTAFVLFHDQDKLGRVKQAAAFSEVCRKAMNNYSCLWQG